jgi:beta-phosphoglucomutase
MPLNAVLLDCSGVIINDEALRQQLIEELLIEENLRPNPADYSAVCLGRSDRACLTTLFEQRGRVMTHDYLTRLCDRKAERYQQALDQQNKLPIYPGLTDFLYQLRVAQVAIAVVSGASRVEVDYVLRRSNLVDQVTVVVAGDEGVVGPPEPDSYLLAIDRLNAQRPDLTLTPSDCLVIEDTPAGLQAAKAAGMSVVGVANTYPFHMMQRQANWAVDYLTELELDRVQQVLSGTELRQPVG